MTSNFYGLLAEYDGATSLVNAVRELRRQHYTNIEAYSPVPVHELDALLPRRNPLPAFAFCGGLTGAVMAWWMQAYIAIWNYPLNVGGRPLYSWPSFVVILFELTVLFAALSAFFGALVLSGFPRIHHPLFGMPRFSRSTTDGYFLCVSSRDPLYNTARTRSVLEQTEVIGIDEVGNE